MIKKILRFFFGTEEARLRKKIDTEYLKAIEFQRNGNIREYSKRMEAIEKMEEDYARRLQNS